MSLIYVLLLFHGCWGSGTLDILTVVQIINPHGTRTGPYIKGRNHTETLILSEMQQPENAVFSPLRKADAFHMWLLGMHDVLKEEQRIM